MNVTASPCAFDRIHAALEARRSTCETAWCVFDAGTQDGVPQLTLYVEDDPKRSPLLASRIYPIQDGFVLEILRADGRAERIGSPCEPLPSLIGQTLQSEGLPLVFVTRERGALAFTGGTVLFLEGAQLAAPTTPIDGGADKGAGTL